MNMPATTLICDFYADTTSLYLTEYLVPPDARKVLGVSSEDGACQRARIALRKYDVFRLTYHRKPLFEEFASAVGDSPVTKRTPLDHAMVEVSSRFVASDTRFVNVVMSAAGEVLKLGGRSKPLPGDWVGAVFGLEFGQDLIVENTIAVQQFPLLSFAVKLLNLPPGDVLSKIEGM